MEKEEPVRLEDKKALIQIDHPFPFLQEYELIIFNPVVPIILF